MNENPVGEVVPPIPPSLIVESLDPNCLMLLIEDEAGAEVEMRDDDGPATYLGDVSIYRNANGEPMVKITGDDPRDFTIVFLAAVKRITVL